MKNINDYNILGVNDDRDYCELCGKTNIARVVWLENKETGQVQHLGTSCAAKLLSGSKKVKNQKIVLRRAEIIEETKRIYSETNDARKTTQEIWQRFGCESNIDEKRGCFEFWFKSLKKRTVHDCAEYDYYELSMSK